MTTLAHRNQIAATDGQEPSKSVAVLGRKVGGWLAKLGLLFPEKMYARVEEELVARVVAWLDPHRGHVVEADIGRGCAMMMAPEVLAAINFDTEFHQRFAECVSKAKAARIAAAEREEARRRQAEYAEPVNEAERAKVLELLAGIGKGVRE